MVHVIVMNVTIERVHSINLIVNWFCYNKNKPVLHNQIHSNTKIGSYKILQITNYFPNILEFYDKIIRIKEIFGGRHRRKSNTVKVILHYG